MRWRTVLAVAAAAAALPASAADAWSPPTRVAATHGFPTVLGVADGLFGIGDAAGLLIGASGSAPIRVASPAVGDGGPFFGGGGAFAVGAGGDVVAAGAEASGFEGGHPVELALAARAPGQPFVSVRRWDARGRVDHVVAAVAPNGRAIVAWRSFGFAASDAISAAIREPGGAFGPVRTVRVDDGGAFGALQVAARPDGTLDVLFTDGTSILQATSLPGSAAFVTRPLIELPEGYPPGELAYAAAPDGRGVLVWDARPTDGSGADAALFAATRPGPDAPVGPPHQLITTDAARFRARVALVPSGAIVAAVRDAALGGHQFGAETVAVRLDRDGTPTTTQVVSSPGSYRGPFPRRMARSASEAGVVARADGTALVTWRSGCRPACGSLVFGVVAGPDAPFGAPATLSALGGSPADLRSGAGPGAAADVLWDDRSAAFRVHGGDLARQHPPAAVGPPVVHAVLPAGAGALARSTGRLPVRVTCDRPCVAYAALGRVGIHPGISGFVRAGRVLLRHPGTGPATIRLAAPARRTLKGDLGRRRLTITVRASGAQGALTYTYARPR